MRIAFLVGYFPVLSETFILNQITGLIARGHEVHIYGTKPKESYFMHPDVEKYQLIEKTHYALSIPENQLWRVFQALILIWKNFHKAPILLLRSLNFFKYGRQATSLRLFYSVIPFLNTQPYDIVHCQFGTFAIDGMILRNIGALKGKLITSFRGYDISWYVQEYGKRVYEELFATGDFFLANCEFFQKRAIKLGCNPEKIVVHGSGIDCNCFQFKPRYPHPDGKIRIATTCRLIEKKGIEYSIRALAQIVKIYSSIEYNIIGDGYLKEHLQQVIEDLNLNEQVKLLGWKNQPEIVEILEKSHIFIAPSITAKDGNQDAPVNTLKEAMAMGLPVIATLHGGIPELVKNGTSGFLVPERDANAIAEKLNYLIQHPELWLEMGKAGSIYVYAHYDINKLNDELVEIYRQVISQSKSQNGIKS